jgi:preprotein translocase subunit SecB
MPKKRSNPKTPKPPRPNVETQIATLVSRLSLKTVRIIESHAKLNLQGGEFPSHTQISAKVGCGPSGDGLFLANVAVTANAPPDTERDATQSSLAILVVAQCLFGIRGDVPKDVKDVSAQEVAELQTLATFIAWPYVRATIQSLTASMAIPPITIPLIRIGPDGVQTDEEPD